MADRPITPHGGFDEILTGLFDMQAGYGTYRPNGTADFLAFYTLNGGGTFALPDGRHTTSAFEAVILPPNTLHDYAVDPEAGNWRFYWAHFKLRPGWRDLLDWPVVGGALLCLPLTGGAAKQIADQFAAVHDSALMTGPLRTPLAMNAMERLLLMCAAHNPLHAARQVDPEMRRVMDFVAANLTEPLSMQTLAEIAGLSVSRFSHRFRDAAGMPPVLYVERARLDRAKTLLRMTPLSVKEVAHHVGFAGQFYFSLRFKKHVGQSPTAYRAASDAQIAAH